MKVIILLFIACLSFHNLYSQLTSHSLTNRRMGLLNDATSVSWNPALLGVEKGVDLLFAANYDNQFSKKGQYAGFIKINGFAGGFITSLDSISSFPVEIPLNIHVGYGFTLIDKYMWAGVGSRFFKDSIINAKYSASILFSPLNALLFSIGVDNTYTPNNSLNIISGMASYTINDWFTMHTRLMYSMDTNFFRGKNISPDFGISAHIIKDFLIASGSMNPVYDQFRLGLEMNLGALSLGSLNTFDNNVIPSVMTEGNALIRINTKGDTKKKTEITSDAPCDTTAYKWSSFDSDSSERVYNIVKGLNSSYHQLTNKLEKMSGFSNTLYDTIFKYYYSAYYPKISIKGIEQNIISHKNPKYTVLEQSRIITDTGIKSITVQIKDEQDKMISNANESSFMMSDSTLQIISVKQSVSFTPVPVDFVLLMDCSGSMGDEILEVRANVLSFVNKLKNAGIDYRIGGILYGDKIQDTIQPTANIEAFLSFFSKAAAIGNDEITSTAIHTATKFPFREQAQRCIILITDDCSIQTNGNFTESSLTQDLWQSGAKLYSIINPENHNGGIMTRLSLGKEYSIKQPFTAILNDITRDVTTTYEVVLGKKQMIVQKNDIYLKSTFYSESNEEIIPRLIIRNNFGEQLPMNSINFSDNALMTFKDKNTYTIEINAEGFAIQKENIDLKLSQFGDTLIKNFQLTSLPYSVSGALKDAEGHLLQGIIILKDPLTQQEISRTTTNEYGIYSLTFSQKKAYIIEPIVNLFKTMSISVDTLSIKRGVIETVNFELALKPALVEGILYDQKNNKALQGTIKIEDMNTSVELLTIDTDFEGKFSVELKTGIDYRFIPKVKNYISDAFEIKRNALQNGYTFNPNIPLISISDAIDEGKTFSLKNLLFESNQSVLKTESTLFLDKLYSFLIEYPNLNIEVHAHTDNKGGDASNLLLSQNRAKSVIIYLEQKGITNTRMIAKGFGESKPIANNDTAEGRELNRRVEFKLVK